VEVLSQQSRPHRWAPQVSSANLHLSVSIHGERANGAGEVGGRSIAARRSGRADKFTPQRPPPVFPSTRP